MYTTSLEIFVYYALPIILLSFGLPANIAGLIVFTRSKKLEKIGPLFMYRSMFGVDTAVLLFSFFVQFLGKGFQLTLYFVSDLSCKLYSYCLYAMGPLSTIVLVYISLDRFVSIKYYEKRLLLKNSKYQYIYIIFFVLFSYLYNIPVFFDYKLFKNSENKTECNLFPGNLSIVPYMSSFLLMIVFSALLIFTFLLIHTIFSSRSRVNTNFFRRENRHFRKDLRLAVTSVLFNLLVIIIYSPGIVIITFFPQINDLIYTLVFFVITFGCCINFYILFFSNSLFRREIFSYFIEAQPAELGSHRDQIHRVFFINQRNQETVTISNLRGHNQLSDQT